MPASACRRGATSSSSSCPAMPAVRPTSSSFPRIESSKSGCSWRSERTDTVEWWLFERGERHAVLGSRHGDGRRVMVRVVTSTSAAARLEVAVQFLSDHPPATEVIIVGASRGAADDLARAAASCSGATFGLSRFSLTELAARIAATALAGSKRAAGTAAGAEATAARAVFDASAFGELEYFAPVAKLPGFPKALARTLHELRLAMIPPGALSAAGLPAATRDIGSLLTRVENELAHAAVIDRAELFRLAADACAAQSPRWVGLPMILLDVPLDSRAEQRLVAALVARSPAVLATIPDGDEVARDGWRAMGVREETQPDPAPATSDLRHLRQ